MSEDAWAAIITESNAMAPEETGGVLLGYWGDVPASGESAGRSEAVITHAIGPGPNALHGRNFFIPDQPYHVSEIAKRYHASGRRITYLGDWHSHPKGLADPSRKDKRTLASIASAESARVPIALMLIVVADDLPRARLWTCNRADISRRSRWFGRIRVIELPFRSF